MNSVVSHLDKDDLRYRVILSVTFSFYFIIAVLFNVINPPEESMSIKDMPLVSPRIAKLILESNPPKIIPPKIEEVKVEKKIKEESKIGEEVKEVKEVKQPPAEIPQKQETSRITLDEAKKDIPRETPEEANIRIEEARRRAEIEERAIKEKNREVAKESGILKFLTKKTGNNETSALPGISPDKKQDKKFSDLKDITNDKSEGNYADIVAKNLLTQGDKKRIDLLTPEQLRGSSDGSNDGIKGSSGIGNMIGSVGNKIGSELGEKKTSLVKSPFKIKGFKGGNSPRSYESIADVVDSYREEISALYNKALLENPSLKGTITVEFTITANGEISQSKLISSSVGFPDLEIALVKLIKEWKFPAIASGLVTVEYPIKFFPSSG